VLGEEQRTLLVKWEGMKVKRRMNDREATPWWLPLCASLLGMPLLVALLALVSWRTVCSDRSSALDGVPRSPFPEAHEAAAFGYVSEPHPPSDRIGCHG